YYRTWYGNFRVTRNAALTPADFTPYCVTAPSDSRLPGGGGNQICGLNDVSPAKFGQVSNLVSQASDYGVQTQVYNGIDITTNARFAHGVRITGGISTGRTVVDACDISKSHPEVTATLTYTTGSITTGPSSSTQFCHVEMPASNDTAIKLSGVY